jgi:hypothetical protein
VWLSLDDTIGDNDILIQRKPNQTALAAAGDPQNRDRYSVLTDLFELPQRFSGENIHILVRVDAGNAIDEWPNDTADTNVGKKAFTVEKIQFQDLVLSDPVAPAQVFEGSEFTVNWTVTNRGLAPTLKATWTEQIWLSTHRGRPSPSKGDILLASVPYAEGVLVKDQGKDRSATVRIPDRIQSGNYFITAWTDPFGTMLEEPSTAYPNDDSTEYNDNNFKARPIIVVGTPVPNGGTTSVGVSNVSGQVDQAARRLTATWKVTATGDRPAGSWIDRVYLTNAPTLDQSTQRWELKSFANLRPLTPGTSYTQTHEFDLAPSVQGTYLIVQSQYLGDGNPLDNEDSDPAIVTAAPADMQVMWVNPPARSTPASRRASPIASRTRARRSGAARATGPTRSMCRRTPSSGATGRSRWRPRSGRRRTARTTPIRWRSTSRREATASGMSTSSPTSKAGTIPAAEMTARCGNSRAGSSRRRPRTIAARRRSRSRTRKPT